MTKRGFSYKFSILTIFRFSIILVSLFINCAFQMICSFYLSCQIYWHEVVLNTLMFLVSTVITLPGRPEHMHLSKHSKLVWASKFMMLYIQRDMKEFIVLKYCGFLGRTGKVPKAVWRLFKSRKGQVVWSLIVLKVGRGWGFSVCPWGLCGLNFPLREGAHRLFHLWEREKEGGGAGLESAVVKHQWS